MVNHQGPPSTSGAGAPRAWAHQLVGLIDGMLQARQRGQPIGLALQEAVDLVPAEPSAVPILEQLAVLARSDANGAALGVLQRKLQQALVGQTPAAAPRPAPAPFAPAFPPAAPGLEPLPGDPGETDLFRLLDGTPLAASVRVLHVIGAHRYQERPLLERVFPGLQQIVLFEPHPELYRLLQAETAGDRRVVVFPYAVSDADGTATFHLTDNDAASSSLLRMKDHRGLFPHVHEVGAIQVQTRTLRSVLQAHGLPAPDALLVDVQGAEFKVLSSLDAGLRAGLALIYTEASTTEVYEGARPLEALAELLTRDFQLVGYAPLAPHVPSHGNALFLRRGRVTEILGPRGGRA